MAKRNFEALADELAAIPQEEVLGRLHRDGAGAPDRVFLVIEDAVDHPLKLDPVDAAMVAEARILG